ncbi:MAG: SUMF1/EgtB/PvdO family nonheme iron enzyme, partial [Gammaproteobacteria bacterium]|nr:SUMF1/EgtB/PvdO family nonheme iron enzyme [Gammaproteobacteria bacterium]
MHGNVDEWCADGMRGYSEKTEIDPVGPMKGGVRRVVRGGSWNLDARVVRSAFRDAIDPGVRGSYLGCRCARVQAGAEPADSQQSRSAEQRRSAANRSGTAVLLQLRSGSDTVHSQWPDKAGFSISTDVGRLTLRNHTRPAWAAAIGRDHYGLWTELEIEASGGPKITQRLRWIPPGRFLMGSTLEESGRRDGEGPRHQVTLSRGYWLFDTPVTQALWEVVSRDNPSKFRSPQRPVENVSWHQAQDFIERINDRITGLNLMLPSESQWEYACRAGTQTATFAGDLEMLGESNAPLLDDIAWYGGNSGVDFDLKEGWDSSSWKEKQYAHERAGTRKVALKVANAWGLYDMLGNVWEWCLDGQREYRENSELDPLGSLDDGVLRVVRGGSWNDIARDVRSASRLALVPGIRFNDLGFRCARVHEGAGWPCS